MTLTDNDIEPNIKKLGYISLESLLALNTYLGYKQQKKHLSILAEKNKKKIALGPNISLQFEDELSIRYQIQEMIRIEKLQDPILIQEEIDAYQPLVSRKNNLMATMFIEYPDIQERKMALVMLKGIEDQLYINIAGEKIKAFANEDLKRSNEEKTSAVHFLRFYFNDNMLALLKAQHFFVLGCEHKYYRYETLISDATYLSLVEDVL